MARYAIAAVSGTMPDGSPSWIPKAVFDLEAEDDSAALDHAKTLINDQRIEGQLQVIRAVFVGPPMVVTPSVTIIEIEEPPA